MHGGTNSAALKDNRQYRHLFNVAADNRVALILIDYVYRRHLELLARTEVRELASDLELAAALARPTYRAKSVQRIVTSCRPTAGPAI